ncbi:MAG: NYN domain-containing protein [Actinobacteria bacterium]|nr:NYN domain-containing protein [Actinomycetota bacterium]
MNDEKQIYIIDGYNLMNFLKKKEYTRGDSFEDQRVSFIHLMKDFASYKNARLILVFDGVKRGNNVESKGVSMDVEVIYTNRGESADEYIERMIYQARHKKNLFIVTLDYAQQKIASGKGVYRKSAREISLEIDSMRSGLRSVLDSSRSDKDFSISQRLPDDVLAKLEKIRKSQKNVQ